MFKSKLLKLADLSKMKITDDMSGTPMDDKEIKAIFDRLARRNVVTTDVEIIENGDLAILDLKGNEEKYNKKNFALTVGLGLFNTEFENQIIGMKKGESKSLSINGNDVLVEIKTIKRRSPGEITDDVIRSLNIDGVTTVSGYREYLIEKDLKEKRVQIIGQAAENFILSNSEYSISEEDISLLYEQNINNLSIDAELNKKTLEEYAKAFGFTVEKLKQMVTEPIPKYIKLMLIGREYAKEDNNLQSNEEKYEQYLKDEAESRSISFEDAKRKNPYESFIINAYRSKVYIKIYDFCQKIGI